MPAKRPFRFQQFSVVDDGAAMKVGTDAVLLGAWTPIRGAKRILDVGTGSGIIALMMAQRTVEVGSKIDAIDIDESAAKQAVENFAASPWPERLPNDIEDVHWAAEGFVTHRDACFDLIVSNPPFFSSPGCMTDAARIVARHTSDQQRRSMILGLLQLLDKNGRLCMILPFEQTDELIQMTMAEGLQLVSRTDVRPNPSTQPKRCLLELELGTTFKSEVRDELVIEVARHQFSEQYAELTRPFHLRYAAS